MERFEWSDPRDGTMWTVTVWRWGPPDAPSLPGHVVVEFASEGRSYRLDSPIHPEAHDLPILGDLLDWARSAAGKGGVERRWPGVRESEGPAGGGH